MALTQEDMLARRGYLGSSDASAIFGFREGLSFNRYRGPYDVWLEKSGALLPEPSSSPAARLGDYLERALVQMVADDLESDVEFDRRFAHPDYDFLTAQVDGFLTAVGENVEAKTAGLLNRRFDGSDWGAAGTDQIPQEYVIQVQFALACTGAQRAHVNALLGDNRLSRYVVTSRPSFQEAIIADCVAFWERHVLAGEPPEGEASLETLKRVERTPGETIELPERLVERWLSLKEQEALLKDGALEAKRDLLGALGTAEYGVTPFHTVSYSADVRGVRRLLLRSRT